MKRWKWKKLLILTGSILLVVAGLGYWAMNMAVNKVLNAISSDAVTAAMQAAPIPVPTGIASAAPTPAAASTAPTDKTPTQHSPGTAVSEPAGSTQSMGLPSAATSGTPAAGASSPERVPSTDQYDGTIDSNKAEAAQESISMKDKMLVTSIFMKRFSAKELEAFMKLAGGGLTLEEKKEAKKIVMQKLSEEEYDQLIDIAAKLGLSQGKKYSESRKEFEASKP
jgi:hypothetical protein